MAKTSMKKISKMMKGLDYCMLNTVTGRGVPSGRPMSNNHQVDYDGTSYFFTWSKSPMIREIKKNPNVCLSFIESKLMKKRTFISVTGKAKLTTDRAAMEEHWSKDLEIWFEDGLDTKGIIMIEVKAKHLKYWQGSEEGELDVK
jgi:general stress protein 26